MICRASKERFPQMRLFFTQMFLERLGDEDVFQLPRAVRPFFINCFDCQRLFCFGPIQQNP